MPSLLLIERAVEARLAAAAAPADEDTPAVAPPPPLLLLFCVKANPEPAGGAVARTWFNVPAVLEAAVAAVVAEDELPLVD